MVTTSAPAAAVPLLRGAILALLTALPAVATAQMVNVLTGPAIGVYHALGLALASSIVKALPEARVAVQTTKGAVESLDLLQAERGEIAFAPGDALSDAWNGRAEAGFRTPLAKLRGIAALYPNYVHVVARADAGVRTLADLRGKRISVGAPRSDTERSARAILAAAGLTYRDFARTEYLPFGESSELMRERQLDALVQSAIPGASAMRDLANAVAVVVIPVPAEVVAKAGDAYLPAVLSAGTYRGQAADMPLAAVQNYLVTRDGVGEDTVYGVTKALWSGRDQLAAAHAAGKAIDPKRALEGMPVPLHPGAERYYRETGLVR